MARKQTWMHALLSWKMKASLKLLDFTTIFWIVNLQFWVQWHNAESLMMFNSWSILPKKRKTKWLLSRESTDLSSHISDACKTPLTFSLGSWSQMKSQTHLWINLLISTVQSIFRDRNLINLKIRNGSELLGPYNKISSISSNPNTQPSSNGKEPEVMLRQFMRVT